jgi:hypothetical protein
MAISVGIALHVTFKGSLESRYERLRWWLVERYRATVHRGHSRARAYRFAAGVEELRRQRWVVYARLSRMRRSGQSALIVLLAALTAQSQLLIARLIRVGRLCGAGVVDVGANLRALAQQRITRSALEAPLRRPLAAALAAVVLTGAALTAVLAEHDFGSSGRDAASTGTSALQAVPWISRTWLRPPRSAASTPPPVAHVRAHAETRTARATKRSSLQRQAQTTVQQTAFVSNVRTTSSPTAGTTVAPAPQGAGPSPLTAPKGASTPSPLKAP